MPDSSPNYKNVATWNILEATDPTEYNALSADNKALYALIISAGTVNFVDMSLVKAVLFAMFPTGTTNANLVKLLL